MTNTKLATKQFRLNEWAKVFRDRTESGMKIDDYCKSHGISRDAYYYWLRKVKASILESQDIELVEIKAPVSATLLPAAEETDKAFCAEATVNVGNISISVNKSTSKELIRILMEAAIHVK